MFDQWNSLTVNKVVLAVYVVAGKAVHNDRPTHGFVLNDEGAEKDYFFSDGRIMHTGSGELFYLPKGSSYRVMNCNPGGCTAINFDVEGDFSCEPFSLRFRNNEKLVKTFKNAEKEWRIQSDRRQLVTKKAIYDIMIQLHDEQRRNYQTDAQYRLLEPALKRITADFTSPELTVAELAALCGISEVYFRKLFLSKLGVSPKEYLISLRIGYAKQLLASDSLSVGEVATICGYAEPCHFSREFSKREGCAPADYKKSCEN